MRKILILFGLVLSFLANAQNNKMQPLFNEKNLDGWYSFIPSQGRNKDPDKIFVVENRLIHISGKEFGYIATNRTYKNFHLVLEFKWGKKKYPPRENEKRDSGICYYFSTDDPDKIWPKSIECQIQEGDVGDFWMIDSTTIVVNGNRTIPKDYARVEKKKDNERPSGEWNRVEVIAKDGKLTHLVNGEVVNEAEISDSMEGRILLQSEGAEVFYRNIKLSEF